MRNTALFVALEDILDRNGDFRPNAINVLRAYASRGYMLVGLCHDKAMDCGPDGPTGRARRELHQRIGVRFAAVVVLEDGHTPRPLWACARRFGIRLERSILLSDGAHAGAALTAGITELRSCAIALRGGYSAA